ncbi:hypothetical protein Cgig2_021224 [Carnegiea gigantea]|uniref:Rx N-terminal domain-containing protein n=1 Tax=Carnegiea gigantea TaxID=171969 RepID=A0A9Q1KY91_9CARY|nr:hypothetical protein Cgig2_021224 [Carnegiea gigantea]
MESIAADLAKDSVQPLLKAIVASIGKERALAWAFKDDLKDLEKKLTMLNYLLSGNGSEFGSPEFENPMLRKWVKKVADVAYRAEDVVDEYAYEVLKRKLALRDMASMQPLLRFKTRVRFFCFSGSSNPVLLRFRMAHKAKSLKESIAEPENFTMKAVNNLLVLSLACVYLEELPDLIGKPGGSGILTCLRTLPTIDASAGYWGGRLSEIQFLSKLEGRLSMIGLEQVEIEEAKKADLGKKENIKDLQLGWFDDNCNVENKTMELTMEIPSP